MDDVTVQKFKEYDLIIGLYEATNVNLMNGYEAFKDYLSVIKKVKSFLSNTRIHRFCL